MNQVSLGVFYLICCAIFFWDMLLRRVPNWVIVSGLIAQALFLATSTGPDSGVPTLDLRLALIGFGAAFLLFLPFYVFRAMAAGDVKFFALLGFFMGPVALIPVWLGASVLAGLHALASVLPQNLWTDWLQLKVFAVRQRCAASARCSALTSMLAKKRNGRSGVPYAGYLALAAMVFAVWRF